MMLTFLQNWLRPKKKSKRMTPEEVEAEWNMLSKQAEDQNIQPDARTMFDVQMQLQSVMQHLEKYPQRFSSLGSGVTYMQKVNNDPHNPTNR